MIDYDKLYDELTDGIIIREYQVSFPSMAITGFEREKQKAINMYKMDPMFHTRVASLVSGIISLVQKNEKGEG